MFNHVLFRSRLEHTSSKKSLQQDLSCVIAGIYNFGDKLSILSTPFCSMWHVGYSHLPCPLFRKSLACGFCYFLRVCPIHVICVFQSLRIKSTVRRSECSHAAGNDQYSSFTPNNVHETIVHLVFLFRCAALRKGASSPRYLYI